MLIIYFALAVVRRGVVALPLAPQHVHAVAVLAPPRLRLAAARAAPGAFPQLLPRLVEAVRGREAALRHPCPHRRGLRALRGLRLPLLKAQRPVQLVRRDLAHGGPARLGEALADPAPDPAPAAQDGVDLLQRGLAHRVER